MTTFLAAVRAAMSPIRHERVWHICILCAFAFSAPLFAVLTQQFVYLHDLEAGWIEVGVVVLVLTVVFPAVCVALDQLALYVASRGLRLCRNLILSGLFFLVCLTFLRPFMRVTFLALHHSVWLASLFVAVLATVLTVSLYERSAWFRRWVSLAAIGLICFPGYFLYCFGSLSAAQQAPQASVEHPVPVVMVVFDEFSGTTLMDGDLRIDALNFPQFDRLAKISTWYRQGSTVHNRTDIALPALLSGLYPTVPRPPLESEYPGNLFRLIHATGAFDMTVYEPITRLCPDAVQYRERPRRTRLQKLDSLARTMLAVYPRLILPNDSPIEFPPISRLWFGLPDQLVDDREIQTGLCRFRAFSQRDDQGETFLESLRVTEKPLFNFLHIELPHMPWCLLPSGRQYNYDDEYSFEASGARGEISEDWGPDAAIVARNEHRYLQQARFVDRLLGQLLDRLQELELLERSLLIVTADHGVSFRPGHSRRVPDNENLADLLSIPLFVKLPGQTVGRVSDSNVESIDLLPTVAEVLGLTLPGPVDGISLSQERRRQRKTLYFNEGMTVLEPAIPHLKPAVERRLSIFGGNSLDQPPAVASSFPDWHGRSTSQFQIEVRPLSSLSLGTQRRPSQAGTAEFLPCLVWGSLNPGELQETSLKLVLAVNGVIRDSQASFPKGRAGHGFEFLLPEALARQLPCRIELFHAEQATTAPPRLRRLGAWEL